MTISSSARVARVALALAIAASTGTAAWGQRDATRPPAGSAATPPAGAASRGQALYETYCGHCHTEQVHWRARGLVNDWASLKAQVWRWQSNIGQQWSDQDIDEVARYLNGRVYRYDAPARG